MLHYIASAMPGRGSRYLCRSSNTQLPESCSNENIAPAKVTFSGLQKSFAGNRELPSSPCFRLSIVTCGERSRPGSVRTGLRYSVYQPLYVIVVLPVSSDVHVAFHAVLMADVPTIWHEFDAIVPVT